MNWVYGRGAVKAQQMNERGFWSKLATCETLWFKSSAGANWSNLPGDGILATL
jgi:hypothetical protein